MAQKRFLILRTRAKRAVSKDAQQLSSPPGFRLWSTAMAEYRFCTVADEGRVRIVTINRPEVMNALHSEAHWEFGRVWNDFAADPELWVGIITGAGERAFSAGNDLKVQAEKARSNRC